MATAGSRGGVGLCSKRVQLQQRLCCPHSSGGGATGRSSASNVRGALGCCWLALALVMMGTRPSHLFAASQCMPDPHGEGTWSIGVMRGASPLALGPAPLPSLTCADTVNSTDPSTFVADPFFLAVNSTIYVYFEMKHSTLLRGVIGVAASDDLGHTFRYLGLALQTEWHLSYPFVFRHQHQMYMMPEGYRNGDLRLYRASSFPLKWEYHATLINEPLIDAVLIRHDGMLYIIGSPKPGCGSLVIYYSKNLLGPWIKHPKGVFEGCRNAGRPLRWSPTGRRFIRFCMSCGSTYGEKVDARAITVLNTTHFEEEAFPAFRLPIAQSGAWISRRHHHIDLLRIPQAAVDSHNAAMAQQQQQQEVASVDSSFTGTGTGPSGVQPRYGLADKSSRGLIVDAPHGAGVAAIDALGASSAEGGAPPATSMGGGGGGGGGYGRRGGGGAAQWLAVVDGDSQARRRAPVAVAQLQPLQPEVVRAKKLRSFK